MTFALAEIRRWAGPAAAVCMILAGVRWPHESYETVRSVVLSLLDVAPMIGVGLVLSAWVAASGAGTVTARLFRGRPATVLMLAATVGAVTPVCGITLLPLLTGLLAAGVPLAPVMAFWLSAPVTDPGLFAATWAVLGPAFAIGKTVAAFGLGLIAGLGTAALGGTDMVRRPLRSARPVDAACATVAVGFSARIWRDPARLRVFRAELLWTARLVMICLTGAFAAEHLLRGMLPADALAQFVGTGSPYAIVLSVGLGAPLYLDGYAALPLVRGLLDLGMSPGAALAFLVAGSALSIWGILAVLPALRSPTTALFAAFAVVGSLVAGYAFEALLP